MNIHFGLLSLVWDGRSVPLPTPTRPFLCMTREDRFGTQSGRWAVQQQRSGPLCAGE